MSTRTNANPYGTNASAQPVSRCRSKSRKRYGRYSHTTGTGDVAACNGIHSRAANRVPSLSVIHSFSTVRNGRFAGICQPLLGDENALDPPTAVLAMTALVLTRKLRLDTDIES